MEKTIQELVDAMNAKIAEGQLVEAGDMYFAENIKTVEYDGTVTEGKQAVMKKLTDFIGSIDQVKKIQLLRATSNNNASFSEYILDFDMKDGSSIYLHEIIRSLWENGKVIEEHYFKG